MAAVRTFGKWYSQKLDTYPIFTKCTSAAAINALGDVFAQGIESSKWRNRFNWLCNLFDNFLFYFRDAAKRIHT